MLNVSSLLVLGLGKTGLSVVKHFEDKTVYVHDDNNKTIPQGVHVFKNFDETPVDVVIVSPGVPFSPIKSHPFIIEAKERGISILSDIDVFRLSNPDIKIVGVTGTNGKSTTTALVGHILKTCDIPCAVGGNIGEPVLSLPSLPKDGVYVLELSSYQLNATSHPLNLFSAGWLNLTPDHLEFHGAMEHYQACKEKIFNGCQNAVIGIDDVCSKEVYEKLDTHKMSASCKHKADLEVRKGVLYDQDKVVMDLNHHQSLIGEHNYQNIMIAYGLVRPFNLPLSMIKQAILSFKGLPHRLEKVAVIKNIDFVNDSKATNAESSSHALKQFGKIYWILGGKPKTDGIDSLAPYFPKIEKAWIIGEAQERFSKTLSDYRIAHALSESLKEATYQAFQTALLDPEPCVILLSPACASFDQFKDFEHRGQVFKEIVHQIIEEHV